MTPGQPETLQGWLTKFGLERLEPLFRANGIDLDIVSTLTDTDLRELGLTLGDRKRVFAALEALHRPTAAVGPSASAAPPGHRIEAERRQLTVLFCDLVGSTALSRRLDPEDLGELLRAFRQVCADAVASFDGAVAKFMGDGMLAYFGFPAAHEDDPERAVRAALAMVEAIVGLRDGTGQPIAARVGIATGLVVVGDVVETGLAREHDAAGPTLNLAARLQEVAGPNGVVIADSTRRLLGDMFEDIELGPQRLKGFDQPVPAWQIVRPRPPASRFLRRGGQHLTAFVGRDSEVGLLADRWHQAYEGDGQVVLLSGEAGIGKSRLLERLHQQLGSVPHRRIDFQCSPHHTGSALFPVITRFEQAAGFVPEDSSAEKLDKLDALLAANSPGQTRETAALMAALLSIELQGRYPPLAMAPERQRQLTLDSLVQQVTGFANRDPLLLVFEDVHWSDATTLEWLGHVIDLAVRARMLVLVTFRPEFAPPWPASGHISALQLNRLGRRHVAQIVDAQSAGKPLPTEVREQILARADGVPLFVEELTRAVLQSDVLREEADGYSLTQPLPALAIPATLQDSLTARLDRLGQAKEIAQVGAALGREFTYALIEAVVVDPRAGLDDGLQRLMDAGLLFRTRGSPDAAYMFKHALVRDAAYAGLLKSRRQQIHGEIVKALNTHFPERASAAPELLAYHFGEAGLPELCVEYWERAGRRALEHWANVEAIAHYRAGLAVLDAVPEDRRHKIEISLLIGLGTALTAIKGYANPETGAVYQRACALCLEMGDNARLMPVLYGLWNYDQVGGHLEKSRQIAEELIEQAKRLGETGALVAGYSALGTTLTFMGSWHRAHENLGKCIEQYEFEKHASMWLDYTEDLGVPAFTLDALCLWHMGYPEQALLAMDRADELANRLQHPNSMAFPEGTRAVLQMLLGNPDKALAAANNCITHGEVAGGLPFWQTFATVYRGWAMARLGQVADGIAAIRSGIDSYHATGASVFSTAHDSALADAYLAAGHHDEAAQTADEGIAIAAAQQEGLSLVELHLLKALALLEHATPDVEAGRKCLERALAVARDQGSQSMEIRVLIHLARFSLDENERQETLELVRATLKRFTEGFETRDLREARALVEAANRDAVE